VKECGWQGLSNCFAVRRAAAARARRVAGAAFDAALGSGGGAARRGASRRHGPRRRTLRRPPAALDSWSRKGCDAPGGGRDRGRGAAAGGFAAVDMQVYQAGNAARRPHLSAGTPNTPHPSTSSSPQAPRSAPQAPTPPPPRRDPSPSPREPPRPPTPSAALNAPPTPAMAKAEVPHLLPAKAPSGRRNYARPELWQGHQDFRIIGCYQNKARGGGDRPAGARSDVRQARSGVQRGPIRAAAATARARADPVRARAPRAKTAAAASRLLQNPPRTPPAPPRPPPGRRRQDLHRHLPRLCARRHRRARRCRRPRSPVRRLARVHLVPRQHPLGRGLRWFGVLGGHEISLTHSPAGQVRSGRRGVGGGRGALKGRRVAPGDSRDGVPAGWSGGNGTGMVQERARGEREEGEQGDENTNGAAGKIK
jgi:hypothetical protein